MRNSTHETALNQEAPQGQKMRKTPYKSAIDDKILDASFATDDSTDLVQFSRTLSAIGCLQMEA